MIFKFIKQLLRRHTDGLKSYSGLAKFNGQSTLSGGHVCRNIEINGQADLSQGAIFKDVLLVNGDLNARDCTFDILDTRGSFKVVDCLIKKWGLFYGSGSIEGGVASGLKLRSPGKIVIQNMHIKGDIEYTSDGYSFAKLILRNTKVDGSILADTSDRTKVKFLDGSTRAPFKPKPTEANQ